MSLRSGFDVNGNGVLDTNEITSTSYVCAASAAAIGNVSDFEAIGAGDHVILRWKNPIGAAFAGVTIRRATGGYPASPGDGDPVYDGSGTTVTDAGLTIGNDYLYRAFAHDGAGAFASGVDVTAQALPPGHRDPTFNGGGSIHLVPALQYAGLFGLAVDADGRPAASGFEQGSAGGTGRAVVWQLSRAGALDPQFNGGSELTVQAPQTVAAGTVFDSAGRLLVSDTGPRVLRLLTDGGLDPSFGTAGVTNLALGAGPAQLALDGLGRILMVGPVGSSSMLITRLSADGIKDTTFGTSGSVRVDQLPGASSPYVYGASLAIDGTDIVVTGFGYGPTGNFDLALWRFDTNGAPVTTFGSGGLVTVGGVDGNIVAAGNAVAVDTLGRLLVAGYANESANYQMALWRFTAAGTLDLSFGTGGVVLDRDAAGGTGYDSAQALVIDATGRILVVGSSTNAAGGTDSVILRYLADGQLDASFGDSGRIIERGMDGIGPYPEGAGSVALDPWGRIIVGGVEGPSAGNGVVIWRFIP